MEWSKKYDISFGNVVECEYKVAENGNDNVMYKWIRIVLELSTWVNVLSTHFKL